jgi:transposase
MTRGDLTDAQWASLQPLLPPQKPRTGRPNHDHRPILNGILWMLRTGAPWRDLPERYGKPSTVSTRFYRWRRAGIWDRIFAAVQRQADTTGALDWAVHYKGHLRAEGGGKPLTLVATPGQTHESGVFAPLLERGGVARPGRGRPKQRPRRVVADKGYSGAASA